MADLDLDRLVPLQPEGSRVPLFCVHAVSGSAYSYAGLTRLLGDDQPVYGFEAPGFDNDREPVTVLKELAAEYVDILRAFRPEGEYRLLGWSLGGLLSYEMAKLLTAAGCRVTVLTMVDSGLPSPQPLPPERDILIRYIRDMMGLSDETPAELLALFEGWPADVEAEFVFAAVEESGLLPEEFDAELLAEQYAVFRAHLAGFYSIEIAGVHDGPAVHIIAGESPADEMRWQRVLPRLKEYTVPGTHHSVWSGDSLVALSRIVQDTLDEADAAEATDGRTDVGH